MLFWIICREGITISMRYINKAGKQVVPLFTEGVSDDSTILLPPDYNPKVKYPVLFVFPFTGGSAQAFMSSYWIYYENNVK